MTKKVLIAYSSRFGSTEEIAIEISEVLEDEHLKVELLNLRTTKTNPSLEKFHGIIVGSGIMRGEWTTEALEFLRKNSTINDKVLGLFVSSGKASNEKLYNEARKEYIEKIVKKYNLNNPMTEAFGGVFDLSEVSIHNDIEKKILKEIADSDRSGFVIYDGKLNDFRNWQKIRDWSRSFARLVLAQE
ncbi:MAG: flavodoxin domain-containing protein [Candidatus Hodarchaeales archaeon]